MRQIPFYVVDSFTDTPFQGNPAGVFFDSEASLTGDEMRRLAGEVHLESAFVLPTDPNDTPEADFRLRYFTGVNVDSMRLCRFSVLLYPIAYRHYRTTGATLLVPFRGQNQRC